MVDHRLVRHNGRGVMDGDAEEFAAFQVLDRKFELRILMLMYVNYFDSGCLGPRAPAPADPLVQHLESVPDPYGSQTRVAKSKQFAVCNIRRVTRNNVRTYNRRASPIVS